MPSVERVDTDGAAESALLDAMRHAHLGFVAGQLSPAYGSASGSATDQRWIVLQEAMRRFVHVLRDQREPAEQVIKRVKAILSDAVAEGTRDSSFRRAVVSECIHAYFSA